MANTITKACIHSGPLRLENQEKVVAYARRAINIVWVLGAL
jgi:hypothetical protein